MSSKWRACADPESFVNGGSALTTLFFCFFFFFFIFFLVYEGGSGIQIPL